MYEYVRYLYEYLDMRYNGSVEHIVSVTYMLLLRLRRLRTFLCSTTAILLYANVQQYPEVSLKRILIRRKSVHSTSQLDPAFRDTSDYALLAVVMFAVVGGWESFKGR